MKSTRDDRPTTEQNVFAFLPGGGEMGRRVRAFDWSTTPLGPIEQWPDSLRATVTTLLHASHPMLLFWGPEMIQFYNDAFRPSLGADKHPKILGQGAREAWADAWPIVGSQIEAVMNKGEATWNEDFLIPIVRNNRLEEVFWTYGYSPVWGDRGAVDGVLVVVNETTGSVVGQRRLRTLGDLAAATSEIQTAEEVCSTACQVLANNPNDLPFALVYLLDSNGKRAHLACSTGLEPGAAAAPTWVDLNQNDEQSLESWPIAQVARTGEAVWVEDATARFSSLPGGPWPEPSEQAVVLPIAQTGPESATGALVVGISPRRPLDVDYQRFLKLVSDRIAIAIANARAHEQERQRAEALADLDRAKSAFFANVSHEFRTPLTLILGPVEEMLAKEDNGLAPESREQLEVVHRNSQRLLKLVKSMLDFASIEAGRIDTTYEPIELAEYTAELASVFRSALERAGLRLHINCPPLSQPVYVDRDMWERIVFNLLSNAFEFTLAGEIEVKLEEIDGQARLTVRDTGVGIAAEEIPRIFDRFHRVKESRGRTHEGAGIGLALVKELVKLHGGSVYAESVLNKGSRFIVTIPLGKAHLKPQRIRADSNLAPKRTGAIPTAQDALPRLPDTKSDKVQAPAVDEHVGSAASPLLRVGGAQEGERPRILWADDNADMRDYVSRLLSDRFEVEAVADGQAALQAALTAPPALILADVMMPKLDGLSLLGVLRNHVQLKEIPVILLSARADEEGRIEGMQAGADDYLVKPFSARELLACVESQVRISQMRREANEGIRRSEARARLAMEIAQLGSWTYDPETKLIHLDERMRAIWGVSNDVDVIPHMTVMARIHDDDRLRLREQIAASLDPTNAGRYAFEYRIAWPDGTIRWVSTNAQARFEGSNRQPVMFIGTAKDITERKQAEEKLRRTEMELADFFENATIGLHWVGPDGTILRANRSELDLLGYSADEYIGHHIAEFHAEQDVIEDILQRLWAGEVLHEYEARMRCKDGSIREVLIDSSVMWENGEFIHSRCFTRDVTGRKQAEQARAMLAALVQSSGDAIVSKTLDGLITSWNTRAERMFGYTAEEAIGQSILMIIPPELQHEEQEILTRLRRGERVSHFDTVRMARDGRRIDISLNISPMRDDSGLIIGASKIARDISERKQAEEALSQLNKTLESRVQERTIQLHRQNQRLRRLADQLSQVEQQERRRLAKTLHDGLQQILLGGKIHLAMFLGHTKSENVKHMEAIFDEAIEICRLLTYELYPPVLHTSDLSGALKWLARWFQENHRLVVDLWIGVDVPVISDSLKIFLFDAVRELLFNVVKHSGDNSATLELRYEQSGQIYIFVIDDGQGFNSGKMEQDDKMLKGFGLFSISERMSALGGSLQIDSQPGKGTRCILSVPLTGGDIRR